MRTRNGALTVLLVLALSVAACSTAAEAASPAAVAGSETNAALAVAEPAATTVSYPIVDTGQNTCYDNANAIACPQPGAAFYGQDAQYDGNQPSYTLSADGLTVHDNVTGLTWTQSPDLNGDGDIDVDDKLTFNEAQAYPDTLNVQNYGGYSDWRLPTMKELYSLMDFRGTDPSGPGTFNLMPFIDTDYFAFGYGDESAGERNIDAQFWSSNAYVGSVFGNRTAAFGLNLADGRIKGYPTTKLNYVYFVRGNTAYGINDFVDNGDGTITDNATGLMWSQDDSGDGMNWEEALAWVQQRNAENYLGYSDWRLPNAKEMQSIVDYSRAPDATRSAAIDPVFNITQITNEASQVDYPWFWTSTTHVRANGSGAAGVYICFGRATGYMHSSWIDVHGAGAQRSDPKSGDPTSWSAGHGPQGDAIRIYNYVRLVRGGATATQPTGGTGGLPSTGSQPSGQPGSQPPTGGQPGGQLPTGSQPGGQSSERPDASGRVTAVSGTTIRVENPHDGAVAIVTNASTEFRVNQAPGSLSDVAEGKFVMAFGEMQNDGALLATLVIVSDAPPRGGPSGGSGGPPGQGPGSGGGPGGPGQGPGPGQRPR